MTILGWTESIGWRAISGKHQLQPPRLRMFGKDTGGGKEEKRRAEYLHESDIHLKRPNRAEKGWHINGVIVRSTAIQYGKEARIIFTLLKRLERGNFLVRKRKKKKEVACYLHSMPISAGDTMHWHIASAVAGSAGRTTQSGGLSRPARDQQREVQRCASVSCMICRAILPPSSLSLFPSLSLSLSSLAAFCCPSSLDMYM